MIENLQNAEIPARSFDVCISGAGPAGITLALQLADSGKSVLLLEAGGLEFDARSQAIYECENTGGQIWPSSTRLRYFGGTSNHWAGRCRPFERFDFERPSYGDLPGWPISFDEFNRYLPMAMEILELADSDFPARNVGLDAHGFEADSYLQSPPTRFGIKYREHIEKNSNISLYLNANTTLLEFDESGTVTGLKVKSYGGAEFDVRASAYIFAMGAIENARILLNNRLLDGTSPGNQSGFLGRCFMEHFNIQLGEFLLEEDSADTGWQFFTKDSLASKFNIGRSNVSFGLVSEVRSYGRTAEIKSFFKTLACDWGIEKKVEFISKFNCPGTGIVTTLMEQVSAPGSAVELVSARDELGLKKARVHWQLSQADVHTIKTIALEVAKAFSAAGLGYVKVRKEILEDNGISASIVSPHAHHMGTTRMAASSEYGVVDDNCRVHGTNNLYVAGSSVFPTGGGGAIRPCR